ncbi:MAG: nuclear transport factor 2 family protein [Terriglobales bacterium]
MKCDFLARVITLVIGSCLCSLAQQAPDAAGARPLSPLEESLISQSRAVPQAERGKDIGTLQRLLSEDFQQVGSEGVLHQKRELLDDAKDGRLTAFTLYNFKVFQLDENAAIVTFDAVIQQPEGDNEFAPRYQHLSDVWVKQGEQWRLRFQQATARRPID